MATNLHRSVRYVLIATGILLALFVTAQVAQLVFLASTVHPAFGTVVAVGLLGVVAWLIAVPLLGYLRLERALVPPEAS